MKTVLSIAGSDSSGGAGIQADLKTMLACGVYGMSAITALTAQNTTGVAAIMEVTPDFLGQQLDMIFTDIFPDAVKVGMVADKALIHVIREKLEQYHPGNIVADPVMVATSGARLIVEDAIEALKEELFPVATLITPNIPEAEVLTGWEITDAEKMEEAARIIGQQYHCSVLVKGGHRVNDANDVLYDRETGRITLIKGRRIDNPNTHGTGCTLSSAIASFLAKGENLPQAVVLAKEYLSSILQSPLNLGAGSGPLDHGYLLRDRLKIMISD